MALSPSRLLITTNLLLIIRIMEEPSPSLHQVVPQTRKSPWFLVLFLLLIKVMGECQGQAWQHLLCRVRLHSFLPRIKSSNLRVLKPCYSTQPINKYSWRAMWNLEIFWILINRFRKQKNSTRSDLKIRMDLSRHQAKACRFLLMS